MIYRFSTFFFLLIGGTLSLPSFSQSEIKDNKFKFLAYKKIPAWTGLITGWQKEPVVHIYDFNAYQGHAQFYSVGLKNYITFKQFKTIVKEYPARHCLPFFLYDLRDNPIPIGDEKYNWALRLEDYAYTDNTEQMMVTVEKAVRLLEKRIEKETGKQEKVCVVLYTGKDQKPNYWDIRKNQRPMWCADITLNQLLEHCKAAKMQVLNPGTAYGYLRYIPADSTELIRLKSNDIAVFEKTPVKVPLVAAIITLEPQTPLSHVNLLAINRKTPNLYVSSLKDIPGSGQLMNKLVRLYCDELKISLGGASYQDATKFWEKNRQKLTIPSPDTSKAGIFSPGLTPADLSPGTIGAKAANYFLLQQHFPDYVQGGYAIPLLYYFRVLKSSGADELVKLLVNGKVEYRQDAVLEEIRDRIRSARYDSTMIDVLVRLMNTQYLNQRLRIRSSTNCEDLPRFNGAGLYLSLGIKPNDTRAEIRNKILEVYASMWTRTAYDERNYYSIDHSKAGMGILINPAYEDEFANGVILTIPDKDVVSILVNTQAGDHLVTNPGSGDVPEELLFSKNNDEYEVRSKSNIGDVFLLNDTLKALLPELRKLTLDIHALLTKKVNTEKEKYGVDIEFKVLKTETGYKLMVKQARLLYAPLPVE